LFLLIPIAFLATTPAHANDSPECYRQVSTETLLGDFGEDWDDHWKSKTLYRPRTKYELVVLGGEPVLLARSKRSASLFYREVDVVEPEAGWISWRWRVEKSLTRNTRETEKKGDDYSARVFVVFDPGSLQKDARTICYVWAGNQPVGSVYPNPYSKNVSTVVLQSGDERAGEWVSEEQNVVADFERLFGERPPAITAVAVMVDTDNTRSEARAWFDDIVLSIGSQLRELSTGN
jgi:hypothetical protein